MTTADNTFKKFIGYSVVGHIIIVMFFTAKFSLFPDDDILIQEAIKVDLVGMPEKVKEKKRPIKKTTKTVSLPDKKTKKKKNNKTKKKKKPDQKKDQLLAFKKLQQREALEKLNKKNKAEEPSKPIKGPRIADGTSFEGIDRVQVNRYLLQLRDHLHNLWELPTWLNSDTLRARAIVVIDRNGYVIRREILSTSNNDIFDETVLTAIDKASPFPPPPDRLKSKVTNREIEFSFPRN